MIANFLCDSDRFGPAQTIYDAEDLNDSFKLLILHGGEDISPSIYGEKPIKTSGPPKPSHRDVLEMEALTKAWKLNVPVLAICRGAQLACAMLGGKLYQHVPFHNNGEHALVVKANPSRKIRTNSYHHQMMIPSSGEILAHAGVCGAQRFKGDTAVMEVIEEPEVVYWNEVKTLGVQGHPEWDRNDLGGIFQYTSEQLNKLFGVNCA
jgi:putative glutamine amidotransferase